MARPGLERHPKFVMLRAALGSRLLALGALEAIWATCYETGDPRLGTPDMVELIAGWAEAGQPKGKLFQALRDAGGDGSVGFIEPDPSQEGRWQVHDLFDHAPGYVTLRHTAESTRKVNRVCDNCAREYKSPDPRAKFCSGACRTAAYRTRLVTERDGSRDRVTQRDDTPAPAPAPVTERERRAPARDPQVHAGPAPPQHDSGKTGTADGAERYRVRRQEVLTALRTQNPGMPEGELLTRVAARLREEGTTR